MQRQVDSPLDVEQVLSDRSLRVAFQPVCNLQSREIIGYEALSRFPRPAHATPRQWFDQASHLGLLLDLELLAVARRLGYTRVVELPVEIRERFSSTVSPRAAWDMLVDTVRLTWRLRIAHRYDRALAAQRRAGQPPRPPEAPAADAAAGTTP